MGERGHVHIAAAWVLAAGPCEKKIFSLSKKKKKKKKKEKGKKASYDGVSRFGTATCELNASLPRHESFFWLRP